MNKFIKNSNGYFKDKRINKYIHQYISHQDTLELKSVTDYIIARQNPGLKFQDIKVFRRMNFGSDHYLVNTKLRFLYGKKNTT